MAIQTYASGYNPLPRVLNRKQIKNLSLIQPCTSAQVSLLSVLGRITLRLHRAPEHNSTFAELHLGH
ncbi:hypothetical protein OLMES_1185 [Oleiphilus messinensis]|uniref:Uncharacterized protein n=1 Tax=Oleiphilus messinensis TaxID=141451 RepID=A0A1Y0I456_9GAMM|nr:hypothetical protein OLMES_1185 [Oleiphilus messinensis]